MFNEAEKELDKFKQSTSDNLAGVLEQKTAATEDNLILFFQIFKGLIQLNIEHMLEILVCDKFYLTTFGALEWDPEGMQSNEERQSTLQSSLNYRKFLRDEVQFKKVIELKSSKHIPSSRE